MTALESSCPAAVLLPEGAVANTAAVLAAARGLHAGDPRRPAVGQLLDHLLDHDDDTRAQVCRALLELAPDQRETAAVRLRGYLADPGSDPAVRDDVMLRERPEGYEPLPTLIALAVLDPTQIPAAVARYRQCRPRHQNACARSYALLGPAQRSEVIEAQQAIAATGDRWEATGAIRVLLALGPDTHREARETADRALARGLALEALARPLTALDPGFVPDAVAIALASLALAPQDLLARRGEEAPRDVPSLVLEAGPEHRPALRRALLDLVEDEERAAVLRWRAAARLALLGRAEQEAAEEWLRRAGVDDPQAAPPRTVPDEAQSARIRARVAAAWARIEAGTQDSEARFGAPAAPERIAEVERTLGLTLPVDFAASLAVHGGVVPAEDRGDGEESEDEESRGYLHWNLDELLYTYGRLGEIWSSEEPDDEIRRDWGWRPGWLPLASVPDGSLIVLDLDPGPLGTHGQIVFADHGCPSHVIAPSWLAVLESAAEEQ
ncbi:SMI1/KNR4 family protein [Kitasatospora sp. LaBMicrA B282]|uniref:SMI1/KNR4 family protein n=1 Tax=Kitasatospora sp. LaBMicrA B282 TaxID=3420949 RepID=UPI003D0D92EC